MNLWPVEHFFHHFGVPQRFIRKEVTSYKIHILMSKKLRDVCSWIFAKFCSLLRIIELSRSWKAGRSHTRPYLTNWRSASSKRRSQLSEAVTLFSWKHRRFLELWSPREIDYKKFRFCRHCQGYPWTFLRSSKWSSAKNQAHKVFFKMATKVHSFLILTKFARYLSDTIWSLFQLIIT